MVCEFLINGAAPVAVFSKTGAAIARFFKDTSSFRSFFQKALLN
jgi:hypothetical protein